MKSTHYFQWKFLNAGLGIKRWRERKRERERKEEQKGKREQKKFFSRN